MTIQSTIRELGLFDLFQILHLHRKTGRLLITGASQGKEAQVVFRDGAVSLAVIYDRVQKTMESLLVDWGVLDTESASKVAKNLRKYGKLIDCIDGENIMPRNQLENFLATRMRETVFEVFKWDRGEYRFIEEELDEKREIIVPLNTENLILEGARRIDEWSNIRSKVPSRHSVFVFCSEHDEDQKLNLKPKEWEILSLIDGKRSVKEISDAVGGDLFIISKLIYGLVVMDVIDLVKGDESSDSEATNEQRIEELLRSGRNYYNRLNLEKATEEFEKVLQIDPECFEALRMLGEIYYKTDRLSEALVCLRKARELRPNNQKAMFIKGYLHARLGDIAQAVTEWQELGEKTKNPRIAEVVRQRISLAKEWEKVLQEY